MSFVDPLDPVRARRIRRPNRACARACDSAVAIRAPFETWIGRSAAAHRKFLWRSELCSCCSAANACSAVCSRVALVGNPGCHARAHSLQICNRRQKSFLTSGRSSRGAAMAHEVCLDLDRVGGLLYSPREHIPMSGWTHVTPNLVSLHSGSPCRRSRRLESDLLWLPE
jgi:hypothetical protein